VTDVTIGGALGVAMFGCHVRAAEKLTIVRVNKFDPDCQK
jgi:hypothetical protein